MRQSSPYKKLTVDHAFFGFSKTNPCFYIEQEKEILKNICMVRSQINGLIVKVPILCPARPPDINPSDFYFWGFLQDLDCLKQK